MLEIYKRKPFEGNPTKKKNQGIITINENVKHIQNIIKIKKTKKFQLVKMILKIKLYKIKVLRSEQ